MNQAKNQGAMDRTAHIEERKQEIARFYLSMESRNFYEILSVEPDASREAIRSAYFHLSKRFHPDSAFTLDLGDHKRKMEIIFKNITRAYEVLSHPGQRREYDEYIADDLKLSEMKRRMAEAVVLAERAKAHASKEGSLALKQEELGEKFELPDWLTEGYSPFEESLEAPCPSTPPPAAERTETDQARRDGIRKQWEKDRARRALSKLLSQGKRDWQALRRRRVLEYIDLAAQAKANENYLEAMTILKVALGYTPGDEKLLAMYDEANTALSRNVAQKYAKQGKYEMRIGEFQHALVNLRQAVEMEPDNAEYLHLAARAVLESGADPQDAVMYAQEAVSCDSKARHYDLLGDAQVMAGNYKEAEKAYLEAFELEPDNKELKAKIKEIKKRGKR